MTLFKQKLTKNLILLAVTLTISLVFNLVIVNRAMAAYGLDQRIKQVKTANSPTVYYLDHKLGLKKAYVSAAAFLSYGNKWSDVKVISQKQLDKWPDLKLVKMAGEKNVYYIKNNKKALIQSPSDFSGLGLNYGQIATIKKQDFSAYQLADYSSVGLVSKIAKTTVKAGGGNPGLLNIELDQAGPISGYLPMGSKHNLIATFNFRAGNSAVNINQVVINIQGVFQPEVVEKVYLANEADYILGEPTGLNGRQAMFNLGANSFTLTAGENKKIRVYVDLKSYENFTNHFIKAAINSRDEVKANVEISGNFPITGGEYKLAIGSLMGQARVEEQALNLGSKLIIGTSQKTIGKYTIAETSGNENLIIKKITLVNLGSARSNDLTNFKLKDSNNNLLAQAAAMEGDSVIFNLNNLSISKGQNKTLLVSADIVGGDKKTVNFNLRDFYATGGVYGYGLAFSQADNNETFTVSRESLNVLSMDLNPSSAVFSKQSGVIIGNFQVRNNNQRVYLANISVSLEKNASAPSLSDTVYLVNYGSGEVYSVADGAKLSNGASLSFNNIAIEPRQVLNFSLVTNIPPQALSGDKYRININKIVYGYGDGSSFEDDLVLPGVYLLVTKSSLYAYPNNDNNWNRDYIKGQKNIKIASFILEAAAGDDLIINQISLTKSGDTSGSVLYDNGFSNLRLYIGGARIGNVINFPSASSLVFDNSNYRFTASNRAELYLLADTVGDLKVSETQLNILSIGAKSKTSNIPATVAGLSSVSRKVSFGDSSAEVKIIDGGSFTPDVKDNNVGRFSIANTGAEDIRLDSLNLVTSNDGFSNSLGFSNLNIVEASQLSRIGGISRPVAGANTMSLGGFTIKAGETKEFNIRVTADTNVPENGFDIYLTNLKATGRKSNLKVIISGDPTDKLPVNNTSLNIATAAGQPSAIRLAWPVVSRTINYGFHDPSYPFRSAAGHDGIDIDTAQGTPVKAAAAGVVVDLRDTHTEQYNYVNINHGNGMITVYGHLSEISIKVGDTVTAGQIIGLSGGLPGSIGSGPNTNGPHLHFGVSQDGIYVDPMGLLN